MTRFKFYSNTNFTMFKQDFEDEFGFANQAVFNEDELIVDVEDHDPNLNEIEDMAGQYGASEIFE